MESENAMPSTPSTSYQREEDFTYEDPKKSGCKKHIFDNLDTSTMADRLKLSMRQRTCFATVIAKEFDESLEKVIVSKSTSKGKIGQGNNGTQFKVKLYPSRTFHNTLGYQTYFWHRWEKEIKTSYHCHRLSFSSGEKTT